VFFRFCFFFVVSIFIETLLNNIKNEQEDIVPRLHRWAIVPRANRIGGGRDGGCSSWAGECK